MSENLGLGKLITTDQNRDAIHIAVVPVHAGQHLRPGDPVGMMNGLAFDSKDLSNGCGVVDPFLPSGMIVKPRERFWLYLKPGSITSLRHEWTHPDFPVDPVVPVGRPHIPDFPISSEEADQQRARIWIESYSGGLGIRYQEMMDTADEFYQNSKNGRHGGDYICHGGDLEGIQVSKEFWENYGILRGIEIEQEHCHSFFTCSC